MELLTAYLQQEIKAWAMVSKYQTKCQNHTAEYNLCQCTPVERQRNILLLMHRCFLKARYSFFNSHTFILTYTGKDCISQHLFLCLQHTLTFYTLDQRSQQQSSQNPQNKKPQATDTVCLWSFISP